MNGMNEAETCQEYITPAVRDSGWSANNNCKVRREVHITEGRIQGPGRRGKKLIADYVLEHRNRKLAIIEAKKWDLGTSAGVSQAKEYAKMMNVRFTYSSNGQGFYEIDMVAGEERRISISEFPTPEDLWERTFSGDDEWRDRFATIPFEDKGGQWKPRYYQDNAVEKALQAIANGDKRILLTLATGTGKTAIAFQITWKLFQTRWNLDEGVSRRPRILFLADRNILADQARMSFSQFPDDAISRIRPSEIKKNGRVPLNANIFFTIFQTFMSGDDGEEYFGQYPGDFFDLVVIDECHRGGANDEGNWRGILDHFSPAVQLGLTATPKRKDNVDTYAYFGEPVYTYSLKQGVNDGFLTPFRVQKITTEMDTYVHTSDDAVIRGEIEEGKEYSESDFARRRIFIRERLEKRVEIFMDSIDQSEKSIVFCATQAEAAEARDMINQRRTSTDVDYCARVTADDGELGEQALRKFQDNEKSIPTILTTSRKLSTGVDARNVRHIVLFREITSMIEFKQIIGRGTRLHEDKHYFTIHDFVNASKKFSDPEWDGEQVEPEPAESRQERKPRDPVDKPPKPEMIEVELAPGKALRAQWFAATMFYGPDGKPMSSTEFIKKLFGTIPSLFKDEAELRRIWSNPDTRRKLLDRLSEENFTEEALEEMKRIINAERSDIYDVLSHIAYMTPTVTREDRARMAMAEFMDEYGDEEKLFLEFVLGHYIDEGVGELDSTKLPQLLELKYGSPRDAVNVLGDAGKIREMFIGFQRLLYAKGQTA